jgi:hypothetical protein
MSMGLSAAQVGIAGTVFVDTERQIIRPLVPESSGKTSQPRDLSSSDDAKG